MASNFGIDTSNFNSYFSSAAGSASRSDTAGSLLSSMGSTLGDYSLIKSGSYKKLLDAYYSRQNTESAEESTESKAEKINLVKAKDDAAVLNESVQKLMNTELTEDNREKIKENLKSVIESYNKLIDSGSEVDNKSVLRNTLWMTQSTQSMTVLLNEIGVTIGTGNKLTLDEDKLDTAKLSTMKTLFNSKDSYMGKLLARTNTIAKLSAAASSDSKRASAYTNLGEYNNITASTMINKLS